MVFNLESRFRTFRLFLVVTSGMAAHRFVLSYEHGLNRQLFLRYQQH